MEESWRRKCKVVRKWNVIVWKGILFFFCLFSTKLTVCVFVTRDTVRHPRRFVFGKFVRKPNCSWSEAFVNRGLTVFVNLTQKFKCLSRHGPTKQRWCGCGIRCPGCLEHGTDTLSRNVVNQLQLATRNIAEERSSPSTRSREPEISHYMVGVFLF
jgi:hypothetical protein